LAALAEQLAVFDFELASPIVAELAGLLVGTGDGGGHG